MLNQNRDDFRKWLRLQKGTATAHAGDCCHCWLGLWFEAQGVHVWGVFPQSYLERCSDAPGGASQEVLLDDPEEDNFYERDRIPLVKWACEFGCEIDRLYYQPFRESRVSRNQALAVLAGVKS